MQKILLLIDPNGIDQDALKFAMYLAQSGKSKLTGLFIKEDALAHSHKSSEPVTAAAKSGATGEIGIKPATSTLRQNREAFSGYYLNHGYAIEPEMIEVSGKEEIITETRFADILIVSSESSLEDSSDGVPGNLCTYILKNSECAVIVAPLSFDGVDEIVFAYDGSASSVFAIREFSNLLPQFDETKVTFLQVKNDESTDISDQQKITDYLKMHYSMIGYRVLHGEAENELLGYFTARKNTMVVMGAFGKSSLANFFHRSTASLLLKTTTLPVFITHK